MEEIQSICRDADMLPTADLEVKQHILDSVLTRFRKADRFVSTVIDQRFKRLAEKHRREVAQNRLRSSLPPIRQPAPLLKPPERVDSQLQRKILAELVLPKSQSNQQSQVQRKKQKPKHKHLYSHMQPLNSLQRFYNFEEVELPPDRYSSSGIYQLVNVYKPDNVSMSYLEEVQPKAVRNKLSNRNLENKLSNINMLAKSTRFRQTIKLLGEEQEQLFLTRVGVAATHGHAKAPPQVDVAVEQPSVPTQQSQPQEKIIIFEQLSYLTINKYQLVEDQEFKTFQLQHLPSWGRIVSAIQAIIRFLQKYCIRSATVRGNVLLNMDSVNRRMTEASILDCFVNRPTFVKLKKEHRVLQLRQDKNRAARTIQQCWRGLVIVKRQKKNRQKKQSAVSRLVCQWRHLKIRRQLKHLYENKFHWCVEAQQRLQANWAEYEQAVEIHIPSFSLEEWNRLTTHHMASFERQLSRLWRAQNRAVILVMPAANQALLSQYFRMLPLNRPELHIIVPDNIQSFPKYLPLASILYYSHKTIRKIKDALAGRPAYIVPGRISSMKEEVLLSYELQTPLYCPNVKVARQWLLSHSKQLFRKAELPTLPSTSIEPDSNLEFIAAQLLILIVRNPTIPVWLLKIDSEFQGRGVGWLSPTQDKEVQRLVAQMADSSSSPAVCQSACEHLHRVLLKLLEHRLNCCEQLYRRSEFLVRFMEKGGIIEAQPYKQLNMFKTYEIALEITPVAVSLRGVLRCVQMSPYCSKAFVKGDCLPISAQAIVDRLAGELTAVGFRGFCSVTLIVETTPVKAQSICSSIQGSELFDPNEEQPACFYMIDIKPFLTSAASSLFLMQTPAKKYLFVQQISHANIHGASPFQLLGSIRRSKEKEQGCVLLANNGSYSLLISDRELAELRRSAVEVLRAIQYRGTSTLSGEKDFLRSDFYSLSEIATAIKTAL